MKTPLLRDRYLAVLRSTFQRFPCVQEVRLFGSRANGEAHRASDIDLAIAAPDASLHDWLTLAEALHTSPIIYALDIVRLDQTHPTELISKITRESLPIYTKANQYQ